MTMEEHYAAILEGLGYDLTKEGLKDTPKRHIKALRELTTPEPFTFTTFESEGHSTMVLVKDVPFYSLCEHHVLPFYGKAHLAYIPDKRIAGLSKLPRTLHSLSKGLNNQERITNSVVDMLMKELSPLGAAVVIEAEHMCMSMRGACVPGSVTRTHALRGRFLLESVTRQEFWQALTGSTK